MRCTVFLLVLASAGCAVEPVTGTWTYDDQTPSGCGTGASYVRDEDGLFELRSQGDGTFTVDPGGGGESFDCQLDGDSYDCPKRLSRTIELSDALAGLDGTARVHVSIAGQFESSESATGTQTGELDCSGSGCAVAASQLGASFPCSVTVDFQASFAGAR
jgi:hypothetical protein